MSAEIEVHSQFKLHNANKQAKLLFREIADRICDFDGISDEYEEEPLLIDGEAYFDAEEIADIAQSGDWNDVIINVWTSPECYNDRLFDNEKLINLIDNDSVKPYASLLEIEICTDSDYTVDIDGFGNVKHTTGGLEIIKDIQGWWISDDGSLEEVLERDEKNFTPSSFYNKNANDDEFHDSLLKLNVTNRRFQNKQNGVIMFYDSEDCIAKISVSIDENDKCIFQCERIDRI